MRAVCSAKGDAGVTNPKKRRRRQKSVRLFTAIFTRIIIRDRPDTVKRARACSTGARTIKRLYNIVTYTQIYARIITIRVINTRFGAKLICAARNAVAREGSRSIPILYVVFFFVERDSPRTAFPSSCNTADDKSFRAEHKYLYCRTYMRQDARVRVFFFPLVRFTLTPSIVLNLPPPKGHTPPCVHAYNNVVTRTLYTKGTATRATWSELTCARVCSTKLVNKKPIFIRFSTASYSWAPTVPVQCTREDLKVDFLFIYYYRRDVLGVPTRRAETNSPR